MLEIKTSKAQALSTISMIRSSVIENLDKCANMKDEYPVPYDFALEINRYPELLKEHIRGLFLVEPSIAKHDEYLSNLGEFRQWSKEYLARIDTVSRVIDGMSTQVILPASEGLARAESLQLARAESLQSDRRVFVVHGHDSSARDGIARLLSLLGLNAIILHEQPNKGATIIEKFERESDVGFAIVALTPDDSGSSKKKNETQDRARQNVILELGYFIGKLGRQRVCALRKGDVEIPSDIIGIGYVPFDDQGLWRYTLAKELEAAGYEVDLNRL